MAAVKRPDLFRGLVLIEPSGILSHQYFALQLLPYTLRHRLGPVKNVSTRRDSWPDFDHVFNEFRAVPAYKRFSDDQLRQLLTAMTEVHEDGLRLQFSLHWEAHNYVTPPRILPTLKKLQVPTHVIVAKPSMFVNPQMLADLRKARPDMPVTHLPDHGHLLPLEAPQDAAKVTLQALRSLPLAEPSATNAA
mgnify:CR=1 FL=1